MEDPLPTSLGQSVKVKKKKKRKLPNEEAKTSEKKLKQDSSGTDEDAVILDDSVSVDEGARCKYFHRKRYFPVSCVEFQCLGRN